MITSHPLPGSVSCATSATASGRRPHTTARLWPDIGGDAGVPAVARQAAEVAERAGPLAGWVNNAAVFRDTTLDRGTAGEVKAPALSILKSGHVRAMDS